MFSATTKEAANITKDFAANDIKNATQNVKRDARDASGNVIDDISDYANQAGRKVRNIIDSATEELSHTQEKVTSEIRNNPVRSSAIALGVGFILGALFRR